MMISSASGVVVSLLLLQAGIDGPRQAFSTCLKTAAATAQAQKIAIDQFSTHIMQTCSAQADGFRNALISFDVKHGIKRAQATSDAQMQVDDYILMSKESYELKTKPR